MAAGDENKNSSFPQRIVLEIESLLPVPGPRCRISGYTQIYSFSTLAGIGRSLILPPFFLSLKNSEPFPLLIVRVRRNARYETRSNLEDVCANFPR